LVTIEVATKLDSHSQKEKKLPNRIIRNPPATTP